MPVNSNEFFLYFIENILFVNDNILRNAFHDRIYFVLPVTFINMPEL